ncbi:MAG: pyridoxamine 5'-phosphate oxidase [Zoogloea sp.]|nr:pyridoxamine 5'-phosphate oxidase [Zoogloea sp.]
MKIPLSPALHLLHEAAFGTIATHSTQMEGYPYATVVPYVADERQRPVLFISALAEHTRNLVADPRMSLSIVAPDAPQVQAGARMTLVGDAKRFEPSHALLARYLRYLPEAEQYLGLDFAFFRLQPRRTRFIGGIGHMGWLEEADWSTAASVTPEEEAGLLLGLADAVPAGRRLLGVDAYGLDLEVEGLRCRRPFDSAPLQGDALRQAAAALLGKA